MPYKTDLGKVVGDKGDCYYPESIEIVNDTEMKINFVKSSDEITQDRFSSNPIDIPMYKPYRYTDNNSVYIGWRVSENEEPVFSIPLDDLKGYVDVETPVPNNISDDKRNTLYIDADLGDIYILNEEGNDWERVHLNLLNYYTKTEIDTFFGLINDEQSEIMTLLKNGIEIPSNTVESPGENVVNVLSNAQVEALMSDIMEQLSYYLKESEIQLLYTNEDGILRIDFSDVHENIVNSGDSNNG